MENIENKAKHPGGRPREHNREQIFADLIEWAKKDDSINVNKFAAYYEPPFPVRKLSEWSRENPEFRLSYEIAKNFLAFRREEWLNSEQLHVKSYDLHASVYDLALKEERREQAEFESKLNADDRHNFTEEQELKHIALLQKISALQSDRKIADKTIISAQKS